MKTAATTILTLAVIMSACGLQPAQPTGEHSQLQDVGAYFSGQQIYYMEGDLLVQGQCPPSTVIISRANCQRDIEKIMAWMFFAEMDREYLAAVQKRESERNDTLILIEDFDRKIDMLLASEPQHDPSLLPQIKDLDRQLTDLAPVIFALREQIIQVEAELRFDNHPHLQALLHQRQAELAAKISARNTLQIALNDLRKQHYAANNGILTDDTFQRIVRQRDDAVRALQSAEFQLKKSLEYQAAWITAAKFVKDTETWRFSYSGMHSDLVAKVVSGFYEEFRPLTFNNPGLDFASDLPVFRVGRPKARVTSIDLKNDDDARQCTGFKLTHPAFSASIAANKFKATPDDHPAALAPLFSGNFSGIISVEPVCSGPWDRSDLGGTIRTIDAQ